MILEDPARLHHCRQLVAVAVRLLSSPPTMCRRVRRSVTRSSRPAVFLPAPVGRPRHEPVPVCVRTPQKPLATRLSDMLHFRRRRRHERAPPRPGPDPTNGRPVTTGDVTADRARRPSSWEAGRPPDSAPAAVDAREGCPGAARWTADVIERHPSVRKPPGRDVRCVPARERAGSGTFARRCRHSSSGWGGGSDDRLNCGVVVPGYLTQGTEVLKAGVCIR